jgi:MoxR-like ATPase
MSVALFVESNAGELDNTPATAQTLLFAHNNKVHTYHRISNGSKGKGQVWKSVDDISALPTEPIASVPVGVIITERDHALAEIGQITNISIKAIYASENAEAIAEDVSHRDMVEQLIKRVELGDQSLADYVSDKRSSTGFAQGITISPIVAEFEHESEPTNTNATVSEPVITASEPSMALNMITVPDPKWAKEYVNRKVAGRLDWDIYDQALADGDNILIEGEAGSGKTISVQSYASARGLRYFNVSNNNGIDPSQLFGRWIPKADGQGYMWQDGAVTLLVRHGGVLLLNEVNFLPARVSTVLFSLLDYRREIQLLENGGEVVKAHKDLIIIADMNNGSRYKGTQELNVAFSDRFNIKLEFPYDRTIENKVVGSKAILNLADQLRDQYDKEELSSPISTRALVSLVKNAKRFGADFAITSFVNGFNKDERNGVRLACETHKDNIEQDLGLAPIKSVPVANETAEEYKVIEESMPTLATWVK